jgi:hypothetical protein
MKRNTILAVLAAGLALLASLPGTVHAENLSDKLQKLKDTANSLAAATQATAFDGVWFSNQWRYGFKIQGKTGIATQSNSPKYAPGDVILRIDSVSGQTFRGSQIYTDGVWRQVTGQLANGTLRISGPTSSWVMTRVSTGSADQGKVAAAPTKTQSPAATGQATVAPQGNKPAANSSEAASRNADSAAKSQTSHGPARDADIVGLRIGMLVDEAAKALKLRHPKGNPQRIEDTFEGLPPTRVLYGLESRVLDAQSQMETIAVMFAGPLGAPSVIGITRNEVYRQGKEPNRQTLLQALIEKYGTPHVNDQPNPQSNMLTWYLDQSSRKPYCGPIGSVRRFDKNHILGTSGDNSTCGRVLQASITSSGKNLNLISGLDVAIYDHRLAYEGINKAREQVAASAARLRAEESKKASSNKPSL